MKKMKMVLFFTVMIFTCTQSIAVQIDNKYKLDDRLSGNKKFQDYTLIVYKSLTNNCNFLTTEQAFSKDFESKLESLKNKTFTNDDDFLKEIQELIKIEDLNSLKNEYSNIIKGTIDFKENINLNSYSDEYIIEEITTVLLNSGLMSKDGGGPPCIARAVFLAEIAYLGCVGLGFAAFPCFLIVGMWEAAALKRCLGK